MAALDPSVAVGVIGAGTMGGGIAQVAATAGHPVRLCDAESGAVEAGMARIDQSLARAVERGRLGEAGRDAIVARLHPCQGLDAVAECGLVIEAIDENLVAKQRLLEALEVFVRPDAILATNTSSLSITALAGHLQQPGRVVGLHFFNPAPAMPLVEVVRGLASDDRCVEAARATVVAWGKTPVLVRSSPGFIVNRIARPFYGEALRALTEGAADVATIDAVLREAGGFAMGPFELMDLIGLDVNLAVSRSVHAACHGDPRYTPSLVQEEMVAAGRLGRKAGFGFYDHRAGAPRPMPATAAPGPPPDRIRVVGSLGLAEPLIDRFAGAGIAIQRADAAPSAGAGRIEIGQVVVMASDGRTATEQAAALGTPVVLFDLALDYGTCPRLALTAADQCPAAGQAAVCGLFQAAGIAVSPIDDLPGMLARRTVCLLANEAAEVVRLGIASAEGVDTAMGLGVRYPLGPLAWAGQLGLPSVVATIDALAAIYGEDRYRASPLLRRMVWAGRRFHDHG